MTEAYKYSILYFLVFSLLLLLSALSLFEYKIGFSYVEVLNYYLGNKEKFMVAKTVTGLFKIIVPHIMSFGLFVMVILHFLIFTRYKTKSELQIIIRLAYITAFLELFAPFFIINGFEFFAYVKLLSFFLLEVIVLYISFLLFWSITQE